MISTNRADTDSGNQEDMRHNPDIWKDEAYSTEPLDRLLKEYEEYLTGRENPATEATVINYRKALMSFHRYLEGKKEPLVLASLTPANVQGWIASRRKAGHAPDSLATALIAVKAFSNKYIHHHLELTHEDLLAKVGRIKRPETTKAMLTEEEVEKILDCFSRGNFNDVRNRAIVKVFLSTGLRFRSVIEEMTVTGFDRISGEFEVPVKGARTMLCKLSPGALKDVRRYLTIRSGMKSDRLWLTDDGKPLTYWGAQSIFRRLKEASGVKRFHAHLCRHTVAQNALLNGAGRAEVQDILGHQTDAMARKYAGNVRQIVAAKNMARYAMV